MNPAPQANNAAPHHIFNIVFGTLNALPAALLTILSALLIFEGAFSASAEAGIGLALGGFSIAPALLWLGAGVTSLLSGLSRRNNTPKAKLTTAAAILNALIYIPAIALATAATIYTLTDPISDGVVDTLLASALILLAQLGCFNAWTLWKARKKDLAA